jgi:hypothetical protein
MILSIVTFGALALPFASFTSKSHRTLVSASALWVTMTSIQGAYGTTENSYIPLFMREAGWLTKRARVDTNGKPMIDHEPESQKELFDRGTLVSVLGLLSSNVGTLTSLLIGVIITYTSGTGAFDGYKEYVAQMVL